MGFVPRLLVILETESVPALTLGHAGVRIRASSRQRCCTIFRKITRAGPTGDYAVVCQCCAGRCIVKTAAVSPKRDAATRIDRIARRGANLTTVKREIIGYGQNPAPGQSPNPYCCR